MCKIPPGCFVMGVPRGAATAAAFDNAEIEVTLTHAFLIGVSDRAYAAAHGGRGRGQAVKLSQFGLFCDELVQSWC